MKPDCSVFDELTALTSQLQTLRDRMDELGSPDERGNALRAVRNLVDVSEALFVESLATFDSMGDAEVLNAAPNAVCWLQGSLHLSAADAAQKVRVARASRTFLARALRAARTR